jgi:hypothetical protein
MGDYVFGKTQPCFFQQFRIRCLDVNVPGDVKSKPPYICGDCRYGEIRPCHTGGVLRLVPKEDTPEEYRKPEVAALTG